MTRLLPPTLTIGAVLWSLVILTAPHTLSSETAGPIVAHVYAAAGRICHQRIERSFAAAGVQLPVCARCSGLYVAGALGALAGWFGVRRLRPGLSRMLVLVAALPTAATWTAEMTGLASISNVERALAALPLGLVAGWVFVQMLRYDAQSDARKNHDSRSHAHGV